MKTTYNRDGSRKRLLAFLLLPSAGCLLTMAVIRYGSAALAWAAGGVAFLAAFICWNIKPVFYHPRSVQAPPASADRLMHPDAAPLEAFRGHKDLLFCLHGFLATPADYRPFLTEADVLGYDLAAPLLPGHGTVPDDLRGQNFDSFLAFARSEYLRLRPRYERVFIVGQSFGGSLALALAEEFCAVPALAPAALATIGSPVALNSLLRHDLVRHPLIYVCRFMSLFTFAIDAKLPDPAREGEDGDRRWLGYLGAYPGLTCSLQMRLPMVEEKLRRITCPLLVCHARGDKMADYKNVHIITKAVGSDRIESYTANMDRFRHLKHSLLIYDSQREKTRERIFRFFGEFRG